VFVFAWLVGEGIVAYRWLKHKAPPTPGALLLPSGIYLALAVLAEYQPARAFATVSAWGLNLAILLQVVGKEPAVTTGWPPAQDIPDTAVLPTGTPGATTQATGTAAGGLIKVTSTSTTVNLGGFPLSIPERLLP
jgi:hypothetical protein